MAMTPQDMKAAKIKLAAALPGVVLERGEAVPKLIGRHEDFLCITGLGGTAHDVCAVTGDSAHLYSLGGAMACTYAGGSTSIKGMLLYAAYPGGVDLSKRTDLTVVSIYGTNDGLATPAKIDAAKPADVAVLKSIAGTRLITADTMT